MNSLQSLVHLRSQCHICFLLVFCRRNVTLLLVGLDNAGKTTALKGIQGGKPKARLTYTLLLLNSVNSLVET